MHPPRGLKGRCVAPIGQRGGCISMFALVMVTIYTGCVYLAENSPGQIIHLAKLGSSNSTVETCKGWIVFHPLHVFSQEL